MPAANADLTRIVTTPGQRSGQPCIRGLRVTVWDVLDMLASGMTEDEILDDFPYLERLTSLRSMATPRCSAATGKSVEATFRRQSVAKTCGAAGRSIS